MGESERTMIPFNLPSNKFYPPHIEQSQSLLRTRLLSSKLPSQIGIKKVVIIEAQAGQGKTTLIAQFLEHNSFPYTWYQIGPEDGDPVLLLATILANLMGKFEDFNSPQLMEILSQGEVGPLDIPRCVNILLHDIDNYLKEDLYIVFDDLHLISGAQLANNLLEYLLDTSPPNLHFVFSSRQPLELKSKILRDRNKISYLTTKDLALSNKEVEDLFINVFDKTITRQDVKDIQRVTNGWVMGIVLASHPVSGRENFWQQSNHSPVTVQSSKQGHMLDYFEDEILEKIPESLHVPFLQLSFITEIHVDLAQALTNIEDIGNILSNMARENFFVYQLDDTRESFRFHHFFQEFLQLRAQNQLTASQIGEIHTKEAEYYLKKEMVEKGLASYIKAGDYGTLDTLLCVRGLELVAKNRTYTILSLLDSIPEETLLNYSWLTLFSSLLRSDFAPNETLHYCERARESFVESGEETGELIVLAQMIYHHFVVSGKYKLGSTLLPRTEELLLKNNENLHDHVKIMAARNLASGLCFFNGEMDKARKYINMATKLASRQKSLNFIASARFIQGYIELLSGNRAKYLREAEICYGLLNDPLVGMSNKLTIRVMYLCYLSMTGEFLNFQLNQQEIQQSIDQAVVQQTVAAPYFFVWGASCKLSLGMTEAAMNLLEQGLQAASTSASDHMRSQLLQWQAYGAALLGKSSKALALIEEAAIGREEAGGPFYETYHAIIAGGVFTRINRFEQAGETLDNAVEQAERISSTYLTICGLMQRSYLKLISQGAENALDDLDLSLSLMMNSGYNHFWSWEPVMMSRLLAVAVRFDIQKGFAQMLSRERLNINFDDSGEPLTLLNFSLLDNFQLKFGHEVICRAKDLTPSQRELLGLLITAKGQRISQERVQLELWPDNSPDNARKSFDTLLTRLRKELSRSADNFDVKSYIFMQKGILCLTNYQMDSLQFSEAARKGMVHSKNSDWWQAGNNFNNALRLWKGALPEETFKSEQVLTYNDQLVNILIEFTTTWATHMAKTNRIEEAISLLEQVMQVCKLEEQLVTLLYGLYHKNNAPIKARDTLNKYCKALEKIDYSQREIETFIQDIMKAAQKV